jgi:hypothetical protein
MRPWHPFQGAGITDMTDTARRDRYSKAAQRLKTWTFEAAGVIKRPWEDAMDQMQRHRVWAPAGRVLVRCE